MSAPPLANPPTMPTMVSRLPKFGSRPKSHTLPSAPSTRLTNGFYHHPGPEGVSSASTAPPSAAAKQNGFIRVPGSFSAKWRMEGVEPEKEGRRGKGEQNRGGFHQYYSQRPPGSLSPREAKRPTASSPGKGRGFTQQPVTSSSSSSSSPQSSPRTLPVSKSGSQFSKAATTSRPMSGSKLPSPNGVPGSGPRSGSSLRRPQSFARGFRPGSGPGSRSGSPGQNKTRAGRSFSSDNLGSAPSVTLTQSDRFRSRSLTQVQRQPSPTLTLPRSPTITRSYSTNRAPPRPSLLKSPVSIHAPEGGAKGGAVISSLLPPSALKKPLLPSLGSASKPSGISYKLSRPSLTKQSRPLRVTAANECGAEQEVRRRLNGRRNSVETPSTTENSPGSFYHLVTDCYR